MGVHRPTLSKHEGKPFATAAGRCIHFRFLCSSAQCRARHQGCCGRRQYRPVHKRHPRTHQVSNGNPDLGIPPLDPFEVPHFDIPHIDEDIIDVDIAVEDLVVKNISTFETKQAHLDLEALTLLLQLDIADLRGDANYVLDGTVLGFLPIYGNGSMWLEVWGLELYGAAGVLINADGFLEVTRMNIT